MIITIDVSELHVSSGELEKQLIKTIKREVVAQIKKDTEKQIEDTIQRVVKEDVRKTIYRKAQRFVAKILDTTKFSKDGYSDSKRELSLEEYIEHKIHADRNWNSPKEHIDKRAKEIADELKKRYDLLFATQIVSKLEDKGLLKENVKQLVDTLNQKK